MNELALFAGAGGGLLASNLLGHNIVCAVERDEYCINVLVQRQNDRLLPSFPIWDDICSFSGKPWNGTVDLVSGGFPCQAFSTAARGRNIAEKDLWGEMYRIVREVRPEFVYAENVSERAILQAKQDLENSGYVCKWKKLSAGELGAEHIRKRYWLLAHSYHNGELLRTLDDEAPRVQKLQARFWESYSEESRVDDGVAYRLDRIKATGNGQVPIVAATAFVDLLEQMKIHYKEN